MRISPRLIVGIAVAAAVGSTNCMRAPAPVFRIPDRVHNVSVLMFVSGACTLSTTAPFLRVRQGDRIDFHLVNLDKESKCPGDDLDVDDAQWKDKENRPVRSPLERASGGPPKGKRFNVPRDRTGAFKYTMKVGPVILDPEIEIVK